LTILVFNFSKSNGAWYQKSVQKVKVASYRVCVRGKNFLT